MKYLKIDKGNKKLEDSILNLWNEVFTGIKHDLKGLIMNVKHSQNVKDLHTVKNLVKLNLIMVKIMIEFNLLVMIIYQ